jgi:hypothetical protein
MSEVPRSESSTPPTISRDRSNPQPISPQINAQLPPTTRTSIPPSPTSSETPQSDSSTPPPISCDRTSPDPPPLSPQIATPIHLTTGTATAYSIPSPPRRSHSTSSSHTARPYLKDFFQEAIEASNPPLRHMASHSSLNSIQSSNGSETRSNKVKKPTFRPLSTTLEEQRHGGRRGLSITSSTKIFEPGMRGSLRSEITGVTGTTLRDSWNWFSSGSREEA